MLLWGNQHQHPGQHPLLSGDTAQQEEEEAQCAPLPGPGHPMRVRGRPLIFNCLCTTRQAWSPAITATQVTLGDELPKQT